MFINILSYVIFVMVYDIKLQTVNVQLQRIIGVYKLC